MAQSLAEELPAAVNVMDQLAAVVGESTPAAVDALRELHARFEPEEELAHRQHIENMREYLWGRTLTFLRQTFKLSHLYVDVSRCTCMDGCCRLADEVLGWGWLQVWVRGMPEVIRVKGTLRREKTAVAHILDKQRFHRGSWLENVCDLDRVTDARKLAEYNDALQEVHLKIDGISNDTVDEEEMEADENVTRE